MASLSRRHEETKAREAFIRGHYPQGESCEFDWGEVKKIQKVLGIAHTDFKSVMGCRKNVVLAQFDKIFTSAPSTNGVVKLDNIVDYGLWCIIRYHNFDLRNIEQEIKDLHIYEDKTKGAMGKQMKKLREMIATYHVQQHGENDTVAMVRALL